ncbi:MAG: hypothetical protein ACC682_14850 [Gemmatimonadota bacterium]
MTGVAAAVLPLRATLWERMKVGIHMTNMTVEIDADGNTEASDELCLWRR